MWNFKEHLENIAVIEDTGIILTYGKLLEECEYLKEKMAPRSLVFIFCNNTAGDFLGYVACITNGCVPALLNYGLEKEQEQYLLNQYKPHYLWVPLSNIDEYKDFEAIYSIYNYVLLKNKNSVEKYKLYDELALLLTTSGSTGSPKFVRQSYKNILSNAKSIAKYLEITATERPITTLPMNYTYGLSIINSHLLVGATILITNKTIMQKEFWEFFKAQNATSFGGVPYTYEMLKKLRIFNMDLPSLKTMTQAGGKLLSSLHKEFAEFAEETNRKFIIMYGQCEATARMAYLPSDKNLSKIGSMGIAIPGGKLILVDATGAEITTPFTTGELIYSGDNVTLGYAESFADLEKGDERHGILDTGDMAEFDEDGYFYIVGRKKRFLKIFGNRVNLDEVERMLKGAFPNAECAVSGIDDNLWIFTTDENAQNDMRKYLSEKTGLNSSAFKSKYINEIPKNDSGKTLYNYLKFDS
ncbi:AMP-dependent synthetase [Candidatus Epulonipiscioides gigas]|nr:AMP-dependent synthetase [Epulopiscium sp. SCG-C07WGA-EpuloA2]